MSKPPPLVAVALLVAVACLASSWTCGDTVINVPTAPAPTPTPTPLPAAANVLEFRVNGNPVLAKVNYSDPIDGLTLVSTVLPYSISIATTQSTLFVSLSATPTQYGPNVLVPFLSVQIFANGILFREASSSDFSLSTISVAGTWRK